MHVVLGANGRAGGETASALIARGAKVRAVVRRAEQGERWRRRGAEVAVARIEDVASMTAAFAGAESAFLLNPPFPDGDPFERAEANGAALAEAARAARLPRLVLLSSVGRSTPPAPASSPRSTASRRRSPGRRRRPPSCARATSSRPGARSPAPRPAASCRASSPLDQRIPMVSTIDIGATAARLMTEPWSGHRVVELGGPAEASAADVAGAFAAALGRPVAAQLVPAEARVPMLVEAGLEREVAEALAGMYDGIASGRVVREDGTEHLRGSTPLAVAVQRIVAALVPA